MSAAWRRIEEGLREEILREVGRNRWRLWFRDAAVADVGEEGLVLEVPSETHRTWLQYTYGGMLERAAAQVLGPGTRVRLRVSRRQGLVQAVRDRLPSRNAEWAALLERRRPQPTLEGFVTETADRFAPLLLRQLVHGNGASDPPAVYLYGEAGSGKTHLLQALHHLAESHAPGSSTYLTSRRFTHRYVSAVRGRELGALKAFEVDLCHRRIVMIDDTTDLAGRHATQAALVRLRERCVGTHTRFVFAGHGHPRELDGVSGRFRSWLAGGVVLPVRRANEERLVDILVARGRAYGLADVGREILDWILAHTGSVHGAVAVLDRWAAASAEIGRPLEEAWLPEVAPTVTASAREEVVRRAKDVVADHYGIPRRMLEAPTKVRRAARPRRVAMYLVYRAAALPLKELGGAFGLRSHSSVSRAIRQIREERDQDPALEHEIDGLLARM